MARKRTATLLCPTEENLTVLEFFAVGRIPTAVLLRAVKGGIPIPQTKNICNFQGSSGSIFLSQFFINHLTLSNENLKKYNYFHHIIGTTGVQCEKMPKMNHIVSKIKNIKIKSVINKVNKTNDKK